MSNKLTARRYVIVVWSSSSEEHTLENVTSFCYVIALFVLCCFIYNRGETTYNFMSLNELEPL